MHDSAMPLDHPSSIIDERGGRHGEWSRADVKGNVRRAHVRSISRGQIERDVLSCQLNAEAPYSSLRWERERLGSCRSRIQEHGPNGKRTPRWVLGIQPLRLLGIHPSPPTRLILMILSVANKIILRQFSDATRTVD